jgi:hypothetical protein
MDRMIGSPSRKLGGPRGRTYPSGAEIWGCAADTGAKLLVWAMHMTYVRL